ncbi:NAD(P)H-quinone oxidoreductase [Cellulomonas rhizosphaerae]|uniref:NAD(P)H-quinone oxidoreductase n=1 Tax=Cellulomonas rhizosphaerae TaxID=2293719 RepID=A0A413RP34_9CELL|nr:NAD(P)H-quinone oxidoreductase [Cellulomonas rhizosphaerae]RHA43727.1 NAD(P)H-quinone oxidoreductase [Cellulomonas rhizosphaerae]
MRAVVISEPGDPDVMVVAEVDDPVPGPADLLIQVVAAGVNRADLLQRSGNYPPPPGAPDWPGMEVAGDVLAGPPGWPVGSRAAALLAGGGYASRVVVPASLALVVPDGLTTSDAAALPEALATVWSNFEAARLTSGQTVLVRGGSGGVGSVAVQVAREAYGARVVATAGGPDRVARLAQLGVDVPLDHRSEDLVDQVLAATDGRGVDVVLDVLGAGGLADNLAMLADGGRLVVIGMQRGRRAEIDLGLLLTRRLSVIGTTLRSRPLPDKAAIMAGVRAHLWPLVADGRIRPVVHASLPLEQAPAAHRLLDSGEVFGKLLLEP